MAGTQDQETKFSTFYHGEHSKSNVGITVNYKQLTLDETNIFINLGNSISVS